MDWIKKNMININEINGLPFVEATVVFRGKSLQLTRVLIDTGSAGTILNVNKLEEIGVKPEANDVTYTIYGIGGAEFVYTKEMERIELSDEISIRNFLVELGSMDYGIELDGIIGYDFLKKVGLVIYINKMYIHL
jgi:predicted aspartyl protease